MNIRSPEKLLYCPDVVLLDLDNTLYDYESAHKYALEKVKENIQNLLGITQALFYEQYNEAKKAVKQQLGTVAASHSRLLYFQKFFELSGFKTQLRMSLQLEQCYWHHLITEAELFNGVDALLSEIKMRHIPIIVVTDLTAQIQFRKLIALGVDGYVDYVVTSEEAGAEKPSSIPYDLALKKVSIKQYPLVWMIGDDSSADIEGAKAACNAVTFQKINVGQPLSKVLSIADVCFESFEQLLPVLDGLPI